MHQGETILPTEIHKLDLSDTTVEVDPCTLRVGTFTGELQIMYKVIRKVTGSIGNVPALDGASRQLKKAWWGIDEVSNKAHNKWVPTKT